MNVVQLLRLEWSKWSANSVFRLMTITYLALSPLLIFMGKQLQDTPPMPSPNLIFRFPDVWSYLGYSGSWLAFFCLGFFAVYMVTSEYSWKTLRQGVINGQSRNEFFFGKMAFITVFSLVTALYYLLCGAVIGWWHTDGATLDQLLGNDLAVLRYFLMVMGYMSFGLLVSLGLRRSGLALFTYFAYIFFVEPLLRWVIHLKFFEGNSHFYYPMNVIEDLMGNPMFKFAEDMKVTTGANEGSLYILSTTESVLFSSIYIMIFLLAGWWLLKKRDM